MASYDYTFTSGDTVTPTKLNNARTVSDIVNADIKSDAAIAGTKIAPAFGNQNITATGSATLSGGAAAYTPLVLINTSGVEVHLNANANTEGNLRTVTNHPLSFSTNNTERMRITSAGDVGIGTTTPGGTLDIRKDGLSAGSQRAAFHQDVSSISNFLSTDATLYINNTGAGDSGIHMRAGSADYSIRATDNGELLFEDEAVERMRINTNGNVGIGTTSPSVKLDVNGDVNTSSAYGVDGVQVVANRRTGWTAATGTATRTTFATSTVTTAQLAERVKALIDDLSSHGLIGT